MDISNGVKKILFIVSLLIVGLLPFTVSAQILPACTATGNCGICDFLDTFVNIIRWLFGVIGGAALVILIWHAFGWLTSVGNKEKIESSRKGIMHTFIALLIILFSWQIVNIVILMLVSPVGGQSVKIFGDNSKAWYQYCTQTGNECIGRAFGSPCENGAGFCDQSNSCDTASASSTCAFWANEGEIKPKPETTAYEGYVCTTRDQCNPNLNLGIGYCPQTSGQSAEYCCKPK